MRGFICILFFLCLILFYQNCQKWSFQSLGSRNRVKDPVQPQPQTPELWKNFYGVVWRDSDLPSTYKRVRFAKEMGYSVIGMAHWQDPSYFLNESSKELLPHEKIRPSDLNGLKYYFDNPHTSDPIFDQLVAYEKQSGMLVETDFKRVSVVCRYEKDLDGNYIKNSDGTFKGKKVSKYMTIYFNCDNPYFLYSEGEKAFYKKYMLLKSSTEPFPDNLVVNWYYDRPDTYSIHWDFQNETLIRLIVNGIIERAKKFDQQFAKQGTDFSFLGYMFDVPQLYKDVSIWDFSLNNGSGGRKRVTLSYFATNCGNVIDPEDDCFELKKQSGVLHKDKDGNQTPHDYPTFEMGILAFYKILIEETRKVYPDVKWMVEPGNIYSSTPYSDEWIYNVQKKYREGLFNLEEVALLTPDLIFQEMMIRKSDPLITSKKSNRCGFLNSDLFLGIDRNFSNVGCTQSHNIGIDENMQTAIEALEYGSWYHWYGCFGQWHGSVNEYTPDFRCLPKIKNDSSRYELG